MTIRSMQLPRQQPLSEQSPATIIKNLYEYLVSIISTIGSGINGDSFPKCQSDICRRVRV